MLVTPTTSVLGRLAVEEYLKNKVRREKMNTKCLQSCSDSAVLPVLKCYLPADKHMQ